MASFTKLHPKDVTVIVVDLTRATILEAREMKQVIEAEIAAGQRKLVIDLSECEFIDSTFLGSLVVELKKMKEEGGELKLVLPKKLDKDLFAVTDTFRLFHLYKTRDKAVKSFSEKPDDHI